MHRYTASIRWTCEGDFASGRYTRAHDWAFDGGAVIRASASPLSVPHPFSDAAAIDPEEAFVAAVASCHMLWFLDLARQAGLQAASHRDAAVGHMEGSPRPWITRVDLHPETLWTGAVPDPGKLRELHHAAHERCFIANSIRSEVVVHLP
ncbi:MAG: OsmC family peroxiredoxin [Boseongicola sp. SB0677_bin_26]|nr:OsmC family peroxiredoxin [Boseongicola sp. SB0665_bin_10]MYG28508.1 OsmC family peroxiredoxin [Boseongicola sp. SB0677_bin_26]